ncbi:MAG: DUF6326 family protein [Pseudomonadota bacterium]
MRDTRLIQREPRAFLSTLWIFFLLNIVFRDIHQFLSPGYLDWVIAGEMFGQKITDELLLFGGVAVEVMLLMVILPYVLSARPLRIANSLGVVFTFGLIVYAPPIDPDDRFFLVVCLITLVAIALVGWKTVPAYGSATPSLEPTHPRRA